MDRFPIAGFGGYEITRDGQIFSWRKFTAGHWMKPCPNHKGYLQVVLRRDDGSRANVKVHTLVATTFIGPRPFPRAEVRHLNGMNTDNRVENLAWGTSKENAADRDQAGNQWNSRKTHCPKGHEYSPENTKYFASAPRERVCITCRRTGDARRAREARARKRSSR